MSRAMIVAMLAVGLSAGSATAGVVFSEDWSGESVPTDVAALTNWTRQGGLATVTVQTPVDHELVFSAKTNGTSSDRNTTVRTVEYFDLGSETVFSMSAVIRDLPDRAGLAGVIAQNASNKSYRFDFDSGASGNLRIFGGNSNSALSTLAVSNLATLLDEPAFTLGQDHLYVFQISLNGTSTNLQLLIDGKLVLSATDTDAIQLTFPTVQVRLMGWNGNDVAYDDISIFAGTPTPEPASMALLGLAGIATLQHRRRA